jgi:hypothetical protein
MLDIAHLKAVFDMEGLSVVAGFESGVGHATGYGRPSLAALTQSVVPDGLQE